MRLPGHAVRLKSRQGFTALGSPAAPPVRLDPFLPSLVTALPHGSPSLMLLCLFWGGRVGKALGRQGYTPEDEEDSAVATVSAVWVYQARYRIPLTKAPAGNWVLLEGLDATVTKTATVVPEFLEGDAHIFRPLAFQTQAVVKIAVEPLNPSELPKMVRLTRPFELVNYSLDCL